MLEAAATEVDGVGGLREEKGYGASLSECWHVSRVAIVAGLSTSEIFEDGEGKGG